MAIHDEKSHLGEANYQQHVSRHGVRSTKHVSKHAKKIESPAIIFSNTNSHLQIWRMSSSQNVAPKFSYIVCQPARPNFINLARLASVSYDTRLFWSLAHTSNELNAKMGTELFWTGDRKAQVSQWIGTLFLEDGWRLESGKHVSINNPNTRGISVAIER